MKFKSVLTKMDSNIWGLVFPIPINVSDYFIQNNIKRFIYTINNELDLSRAMLPNGDGSYFVYINKEISKRIHVEIGQEVQIEMIEDTSEYGMPLPEELAECFALYPIGNRHFHQLTPGKQRTLIYLVAKPKRVQTRINKAIQIMEYLEECRGKLDFKDLHQWFKNYPK